MSRAQFIDRATGEEIFTYSVERKGYSCNFCPQSRINNFYDISAIIGHACAIDVHYEWYWDEEYVNPDTKEEGRKAVRVISGHEQFDRLTRI